MLPKISIITPSFNQGDFIEQTILSIINQGYDNLEFIVVDGGSTDNTLEILKKYESKITSWTSGPDNGQAAAINKGLQVVTGEVFNWINSDDMLEENSLHTIGKFFHEKTDKDVVCGFTRCFWHDTNTTSHEYRMGLKPSVAETIVQPVMNQPGTFYRTAVVKGLGGINESLRYVFDDELWFRYLCRFGTSYIGFTENRLAQFRLHPESKSVGEGYALFQEELQSICIDIARSAEAPAWLMEQMTKQSHSPAYQTRGRWDLRSLEKERYLAYYAARFLNTLYLSGQKTEAKEALRLIARNGFFKWNRMFTSLRVKLMFS